MKSRGPKTIDQAYDIIIKRLASFCEKHNGSFINRFFSNKKDLSGAASLLKMLKDVAMPDYEIYKLHLQHKKQLEVELNDPSITEKEKRNYHSSLLEIDTKISRHEGIINTKALIDLLFDKIDSYRKLGLDKLAVFLEKCIIEIGIAECSPEEVKKWCVEQCKKVNPNLYDRATILPDVSFGGNIPTFPQASLDDVKLYGRRSLLKQIKEATIYNLEYQSTTQSSKLSLN